MKSLKTKLFALLLIGGMGWSLASCNNNPPVSSSETTTSENTGSESESSSTTSEELGGVDYTYKDYTTKDPSEKVVHHFTDYVKDSPVKLPIDYKDRDFYSEGIGQVKLWTPIDGDTAHFEPLVKTTSDLTIKSRFYGIDTPESTGKVQEWGRAASDFTKSMLKEADKNGTIVVSSPFFEYKKPEPDSTGERYLSLIWINTEVKDAPYDQLYLLNLWIVQDGLSDVKNVSEVPQFADTFYAAWDQARNFKLNKHSGISDPNFNYGSYIDTSLLDLKREIEAGIADPDHQNKYDNVKVRITGTVAGYSNNTLYVQAYFTEEQGAKYPEGEYASINIFCGMSPIPTKFTKPNAYVEVAGLATYSETFGFQITDTNFPRVPFGYDNESKVLIEAEDNIEPETSLYYFEYTGEELNEIVSSDPTRPLNCATKVTTPITVERVYINNAGDEYTLYLKDLDFQIYLTFGYQGDPDNPNYVWKGEDEFVGKTFMVQGVYAYHKTTSGKIVYQIIPSKSADLIWQK